MTKNQALKALKKMISANTEEIDFTGQGNYETAVVYTVKSEQEMKAMIAFTGGEQHPEGGLRVVVRK
jgi:hypothetical protein